MIAGVLILGFGLVYVASLGTEARALAKEVTFGGKLSSSPICRMCLRDGQFCLTRRNFATLILSPTKTVALERWQRYSMSLSTSRVVAGLMTMPARRLAVVISHLVSLACLH